MTPMKAHILILFFVLGFSGSAFSNGSELVEIVECYVQSVEKNDRVPNDRANVRVIVRNNGFQHGEVIQYGYDSKNLEATLNDKLGFEFTLDSGIVEFQFYPKNQVGFSEITSHPIHIAGGSITTLVIHFRTQSHLNEMVKKPVIYLYPTKNEIVSVQLKPKGELTFTYPIYENGWTFTATPTGELQFVDGTYNYLFWEAEMEIDQSDWMTEGKIVGRDELLEYLESVVEKMRFTSKEKADFITFWAPQLLRYDQTFVRFVFNEECDQFAELDISPTPDEVIRLYILWTPVNLQSAPENVAPQQVPETKVREGFAVVEWGGIEL